MDDETRAVYEAQASRWVERRQPRAERIKPFLERMETSERGPVGDLGCGPGWHAALLRDPVVALDVTRSMLQEARVRAPQALAVQADLEALPFRRGALTGAWASASYVHVPRARLPMALADLHRSVRVGAPVELRVFGGDDEGRTVFANDDFPGRLFSLWQEDRLRDVVTGAGFALDELEVRSNSDGEQAYAVRATRARTLPDTVGPGMRLLVCGLNPSLYAADAGAGFARPGNRFWPAAERAGLVATRDPRHALQGHRVGMTDLVKRATVAARELRAGEYRDGYRRVERLVEWLQPGAVCFVGLAGWRAAVDRTAIAGEQEHRIGGRPVYVMPSTSGLNAATSVDTHAAHLRAAATLADSSA